ncbi:MAG: molybdopterin oxidoreductase family protein [Rhodospirillales bacterium]|nr:molybdopterin oxidoreductase family protein [Rhodospirillales bacterium]
MPDSSAVLPDWRASACPHDCPSTCSLEVERLDAHRIGKVRGARDNDYTAGVICAKVARYAERQHHPARLSRPLRRVGPKGCGADGFVPIGWDEALDEVAHRLKAAAARHGPQTVWPYFYAGTMGLVQRDGIERLRHAMGYSRQYSTFCVTLADAGWAAGAGAKRGADARTIADSDLVVVWGGNPVSTQVNVMTHVARARKTRGAKFVVVDPYRTPTAEQADLHLMLRPGTDAALAVAVMHVLFAEGYADRDYIAKYTAGADELEAHVAARTPEWAEAICGVPAATIREFARLFGRTKRTFVRLGYGFSRHRNGASSMHAAASLAAITGAWQHKGGGALYGQSAIYRLDKTMIEGLDRVDPKIRRLDQSRIGAVLTGDPQDLAGGPPVTAMFIQNTNPMNVAPNLGRVREGFAREDLFVCVHEQFLTDTARMADIVLPATTFLEHADMYYASGSTYLQVTKKVVEPYAECRSNHTVHRELARRLGASHPGFDMSEWELIDWTLKASGYPSADEVHAGRWYDKAASFETTNFLDGFAHADRRWHFKADWERIGPGWKAMPALPDQMTNYDAATKDRPFRLVAAPARSYLNSTFTETPGSQAREGRPAAMIHPADLAEIGAEDGSRVRLGNERGSLVLAAKAFNGVLRGTVVVESIWPNDAFEEGLGINVLTSDDPGFPAGGGVFHDTSVWVRKA